MSTPNYWNKTLQSRLTRRRALIGTAGLSTLAATTLLACSSDKAKTPKAPVDRSGLIYTPSDSTASAKQGGVLKSNVNGDILHMDGLISTSSTVLSAVGFFNYLRLVKWEVAKYPQVADGGIAGDLCESYEISPDKLVITMKLRPNVKWDARPPTNGRVADTDDILWSWKKFVALHPGANAYSYEKEPLATGACSWPSRPVSASTGS
jgi:ABC-type transport system substrate-binding protein